MVQESLKEAAEKLGYKLLKSDNIVLGGAIPLPNSRKAVIMKEVDACSFQKKL